MAILRFGTVGPAAPEAPSSLSVELSRLGSWVIHRAHLWLPHTVGKSRRPSHSIRRDPPAFDSTRQSIGGYLGPVLRGH